MPSTEFEAGPQKLTVQMFTTRTNEMAVKVAVSSRALFVLITALVFATLCVDAAFARRPLVYHWAQTKVARVALTPV